MPHASPPSPPLPPELEAVRARYPEIYAIVSPPRCCSTALARVFWEHPKIAYYCHEPFEVTYYRDASLDDVARQLLEPLALAKISCRLAASTAEALLVKEMPYQVGACFPLLTSLATAPLVFLLRDPRLNVASRIKKKLEVGDSPFFPLEETGWELLRRQVDECDRSSIPYVIVHSADVRNRPLAVLPELFARLGLEFDERLISWQACEDVEIDNLGGDHSHLYRSVLASTGLRPETAEPPPVEDFPTEGGLREHLVRCLEIYEELSSSPARIVPSRFAG